MPFDPETPLVLHEIPRDGRHNEWSLGANLRWTGTFRKHEGEFEVGPPFETDLASVPRALTWLFPRYGRYTKAAVLHDYLCKNFEETEFACAPDGGAGGTIQLRDRSDADEVFREVMRELKVPWPRRWLMWAAVTYKTLTLSLRVGRASKERLCWVGRLITAVGAVAGVVLLVLAALAATWGGVVVLTVLGLTTVAAGILGGGHVAQGRWDRWLVHLFTLVMTVGFLPFLAGGAAVWVLLAVYWVLEDILTGFHDVREWFKRRSATPAPAPQPSSADERAAAVQAS